MQSLLVKLWLNVQCSLAYGTLCLLAFYPVQTLVKIPFILGFIPVVLYDRVMRRKVAAVTGPGRMEISRYYAHQFFWFGIVFLYLYQESAGYWNPYNLAAARSATVAFVASAYYQIWCYRARHRQWENKS